MEMLSVKDKEKLVEVKSKENTSKMLYLKTSICDKISSYKDKKDESFVNTEQGIMQDIKCIEKLLEINARDYDMIDDESLIEANIYEYRGLMLRYNHLLAKIKRMRKPNLSSK